MAPSGRTAPPPTIDSDRGPGCPLETRLAKPRHVEPAPPKQGPGSNARYVPWADLLRRVFAFDLLVCPRCAGPMMVLAYLTERAVLDKILTHLGLPTSPPAPAPAWSVGEDALELPFGGPTDELAPASSTKARSPPSTQHEVDVRTDDDLFWRA